MRSLSDLRQCDDPIARSALRSQGKTIGSMVSAIRSKKVFSRRNGRTYDPDKIPL